MEIKPYGVYQEEEVLELYGSVGWLNYTARPEMLKAAFTSSLMVLGARVNGKLAGLIRAVGDGASILYIQDILVHPDYQRQGIGRKLLLEMIDRYPRVYQTVLMTDDTPKTAAFYRSCGFSPEKDLGLCAYLRIKGLSAD
ncbi:MAG: GNAT family N-acetyltransferase [Bacillota bacterium]|nr:GNAT family N-acetyltransferase [Bacillota bacterium]